MTQNQQKKNEKKADATFTSTTSNTRGQACSPNMTDLLQIKGVYNEVLGDLNVNIARYLMELLDEGMEPEVIVNAIRETAWARWPSPYYMRAILQRYRKMGLRSMAAVRHNAEERHNEHYRAAANREARWYDQEEEWWK